MACLWTLLLLPTLLVSPAAASGISSASISRPIFVTLPAVTELTTVAESTLTSTKFVTVRPSAYTAESAGSSTNGCPAALAASKVTLTHPFVTGAVRVPSSLGLNDPTLPSGAASSGIPTASTLFDADTASSSDAAPSSASDPLAITGTSSGNASVISSSSTGDPLAISPSSTATISGSSTAISSSTSDPLAVWTQTTRGTAASSSFVTARSSSGSASTHSASSATGLLAVEPSLAPCAVDNPLANEDCRAHLASNCTRKAHYYPTCFNGECVCRSNICANAADCTKYHQCFDDEEVRCKEQPAESPTSPGVCECVPKAGGCMSQPQPHKFCDGEIDCSNERHRDIYPLFAQCVTDDPWQSYPRGRCMCRRVNCTYAHDETKDNLSCLDLIWCHNGTNKVPHCNGKYDKNKNGPDDGYCLCPGNLP